MSTPCRIIVKINKEDIGKTMKFNPRWPNTELPYGEWIERDEEGNICRNELREKSLCENVKLKSEYIGVYCHWDGDTNSTGRVLKRHFSTYRQALNLVLGGDLSGLCTGALINYANREGMEWKDIQPIQGDLDTIRKNIYGQYEHIFENDKWKSRQC